MISKKLRGLRRSDMGRRPDPTAEATAGALGTLLSCLALYPIDTAKVKIQTGHSNVGPIATILSIVRKESVGALFKGLPAKALHVVLTNYLYFFIYEWLKAKRAELGLRVSTLANTICGVIAGVANITVTLPLDTLVVRVQGGGAGGKGAFSHAADLAAEGRHGLWRGFGVSAILTLNPSITFAIFDTLKARLTRLRGTERLTVLQAFLLGSIAKAIATVLTYPLIRTKTVLQRGKRTPLKGSPRGGVDNNTAAAAATTATDPAVAAEHGMLQVLRRIFREEGLGGLYRGCSAQILTAVGKSGILLTTKEKIAAFTLGLLLALRRHGGTKRIA
jgi:adenine nucleotide transporter 17